MSRKTEGKMIREIRTGLELTLTKIEEAIGIPEDLLAILEDGGSVQDEAAERVTEFLCFVLDQNQGKLLPGAEKALNGKKGKRKKGK